MCVCVCLCLYLGMVKVSQGDVGVKACSPPPSFLDYLVCVDQQMAKITLNLVTAFKYSLNMEMIYLNF